MNKSYSLIGKKRIYIKALIDESKEEFYKITDEEIKNDIYSLGGKI